VKDRLLCVVARIELAPQLERPLRELRVQLIGAIAAADDP
jgi:hypothetical protein